jgi:hypothetical protein
LSEIVPDQVFEAESIAQADNLIQNGWSGVIYLVLSTRDDLVQIVNFLNRHQTEVKMAKTIRVGVFSAMMHTQVVAFLQKSAVTEVLEFETNQKAIAHKTSVHLKVIEKTLLGDEKKGIEFDKAFKGKPEDFSTDNRHVGERSAQAIPIRPKAPPVVEEEEGWRTGADAFQKQGAYPKWEGKPVEIVNQTSERSLTIDVPKKDWKVGEKFAFDFETVNLELAPLLKMNAVIESLGSHELADEMPDRQLISIQLDSTSADRYEELQEKLDELQNGIHQFMKEAKG